ncbi:hypothetical protein R69658_05435 [Paraburkholderia aspalathi]|uniref:Uncharacterized protein n=1 Tax=Paraburkholderia aspalathi TaxID=1324617 RepID=A0ABN7MQ64_9BURK|nr:hypothetical protein [Paraburkholderia aspalathi]MBK3821809.1 hypothetical protein [Paraburkholderia aspalathi]MBK3833587.1 hypothetical protein [Paraburkholderia aspalathi]MBK3863310.1 hypothetical protein [Paraburkholderia aspalathi]CAE6811696.1 hypothetical protein R69658_05435 [Paraburkholderia aspalathi]
MKTIAVALMAVMAITSAQSQVFEGETTGEQRAGAWSSFMIARQGDVRFRAYTFNDNLGLIVDVFPPSCLASISFAAPYSAPASSDAPASMIPGALRIDLGAVYSISTTTGAVSMGDTLVILTLNQTPEFGSILTEMTNGQMLRARFDVQGYGGAYKSFPLNGFATSLQRITGVCKQVADSAGHGAGKRTKPSERSSSSAL